MEVHTHLTLGDITQALVYIAGIITAAVIIARTGKGIINRFLRPISNRLDAVEKKQDIQAEQAYNGIMLQLAQIRTTISRAHADYVRQGWIDRFALSSLNAMYASFLELGGNGYVGKLIDDINSIKDVRDC